MPYATNPDDGVRIYYEVEGDGPAVELRHGLMGSGADWRSLGVVEKLAKRYRTILVDGRGRGKSDRSPHPEDYVPSKQVADAVGVLNHLGIERAHFLGYSEGGVVGHWMGVHAPDRLRSLTIGGASCMGGPFEPLITWRTYLKRGMPSYVEMIEQRAGPLSSELKARYLENDGPSTAACIEGLWSVWLSEDQVQSIQTPSFLYVGDQDSPAFEEMKLLADLLSNARLQVLEGLDHLQVGLRSDLYLPAIVRFMDETEAERS